MIPEQITTLDAVEMAKRIMDKAEQQRKEFAESAAKAMECRGCVDAKADIERLTAERDILDKHLTAVCLGVNQRCGAGASELPLVVVDRVVKERDAARMELRERDSEIERLRGENDALRKCAQLGPIISAETILKQQLEIKALTTERDAVRRLLRALWKSSSGNYFLSRADADEIVEVLAQTYRKAMEV